MQTLTTGKLTVIGVIVGTIASLFFGCFGFLLTPAVIIIGSWWRKWSIETQEIREIMSEFECRRARCNNCGNLVEPSYISSRIWLYNCDNCQRSWRYRV